MAMSKVEFLRLLKLATMNHRMGSSPRSGTSWDTTFQRAQQWARDLGIYGHDAGPDPEFTPPLNHPVVRAIEYFSWSDVSRMSAIDSAIMIEEAWNHMRSSQNLERELE